MASELIDAFELTDAWGQVSRGGAFHAFGQSWWNEELWVPLCNRRASYTDLQLSSLDVEPGDSICGQHACAQAHRRFLRRRDREDDGDDRR